MRFAIDPHMPLKSAGYADIEVLRAAVTFHLARTRTGQPPEVDGRALTGATVAEMAANVAVAASLTTGVNRHPDLVIDTVADPRDKGIGTAEEYHAAAVLYAWRAYCWSDLDEDASRQAFEDNEAIQDHVDGQASAFDLEAVDAYTAAEIARSGVFVTTKAL